MKTFLMAVRTSIFLMLVCGLIYPLFTTGVAEALFHKQAEGSLVHIDGKVIGSELLAQGFHGPGWFHPRDSAANYDPRSSAATNIAVASKKYINRIKDNVDQLKRENEKMESTIPADLVTTSGSGLDPDLSPEAAKAQAPRIAKAKGVSEERILNLINQQTQNRSLAMFGEPRVNVLRLNLALQDIK